MSITSNLLKIPHLEKYRGLALSVHIGDSVLIYNPDSKRSYFNLRNIFTVYLIINLSKYMLILNLIPATGFMLIGDLGNKRLGRF